MFWHRLLFWRQERDIFTFWDGKRTRRIDPMPTWFAMAEDEECNAERDMPLASAGDRDAWNRVQAMACRMFGVEQLTDSGGLTEYEITALLGNFIAFNIALKKKRGEFRAQWEHTVGASPDESPTQPDGESSSTPSESSSDGPSVSSPECPPPSET